MYIPPVVGGNRIWPKHMAKPGRTILYVRTTSYTQPGPSASRGGLTGPCVLILIDKKQATNKRPDLTKPREQAQWLLCTVSIHISSSFSVQIFRVLGRLASWIACLPAPGVALRFCSEIRRHACWKMPALAVDAGTGVL